MLARLGIIISTVLTLTYAAVLKVLSQLDPLLRLFVGNCVDVHLVQEGVFVILGVRVQRWVS